MKSLKKILNIIQKTIVTLVLIVLILFLVRFFAADVYYVPTSSMQQTIMPGEIILTNKIVFGARWLRNGSLLRLPGTGTVNRNDIIVFNFPESDTIYVNDPSANYYMAQRRVALGKPVSDIILEQEKCYLPIQQRVAYVKRCVGLPGDTISIFNGFIYINQKKIASKVSCQMRYSIKGDSLLVKQALHEYGIKQFRKLRKDSVFILNATEETAQKLIDNYPDIDMVLSYHKGSYINRFPFYLDSNKCHGLDNYGPLYIPKKGDTLQVNLNNLPIYKRIIEVYDKNSLEIKGEQIVINNKNTSEYIVKQNYYFMMGDNRYGSIDSRNWGFVPESHLIGKAQMILFSKNNKYQIRWNRIGTILN